MLNHRNWDVDNDASFNLSLALVIIISIRFSSFFFFFHPHQHHHHHLCSKMSIKYMFVMNLLACLLPWCCLSLLAKVDWLINLAKLVVYNKQLVYFKLQFHSSQFQLNSTNQANEREKKRNRLVNTTNLERILLLFIFVKATSSQVSYITEKWKQRRQWLFSFTYLSSPASSLSEEKRGKILANKRRHDQFITVQIMQFVPCRSSGCAFHEEEEEDWEWRRIAKERDGEEKNWRINEQEKCQDRRWRTNERTKQSPALLPEIDKKKRREDPFVFILIIRAAASSLSTNKSSRQLLLLLFIIIISLPLSRSRLDLSSSSSISIIRRYLSITGICGGPPSHSIPFQLESKSKSRPGPQLLRELSLSRLVANFVCFLLRLVPAELNCQSPSHPSIQPGNY